jgi:hypothetical protein
MDNSSGPVCADPTPDPTDYGMFALVIISGGIILQYILRSFERLQVVPYTLTVFVFGMILGGVDIANDKSLGGLSYSMDRWLHMDPFVLFRTSHICIVVMGTDFPT